MNSVPRGMMPWYLAVYLGIGALVSTSFALHDGLCLTPPMGWSSWNWFRCSNANHGTITTPMMIQMADAMVSSGMRDSGYRYINIDDCWGEYSRDARGGLVPIKTQFPNMRALADSIHKRGLKFGLYTDLFEFTCAKWYDGAGQPGLWGHEQQDADTFVKWGIDYLKIDYCGYETHPEFTVSNLTQRQQAATNQYVKARNALKKAVVDAKARGQADAHDVIISICEWGTNKPYLWGDSVGHLWRTANDITIDYTAFLNQIETILPLGKYAGPGGWNDPDMMQVGNGLSVNEDRVHFSLWCMMAAPLIAGNDLRAMTAATRATLTNREAVGINQDSLGAQAVRVKTSSTMMVLAKKMKNGGYAVCYVNRGNSPTTISATWQEIGTADPSGVGIPSGTTFRGRNIWGRADLGTLSSSYTATNVPARDVFLFRLYPMVGTFSSGHSENPMANSSIVQSQKNIIINPGISGRYTVDLLSLNGRTIGTYSHSGANPFTIATDGIMSGLYMVTVRSGLTKFSQRVLIK